MSDMHVPEDKPAEMDQVHRERVCTLLWETGSSPSAASRQHFLAAYQAVLTKDLLWAVKELLYYKQQEVHK
jgi:hypothetical protein